jgi:hypothetical protein
MWKEYGRARHGTQRIIIRWIRFTYWLDESIGTHSEYVKLIAFSRQQYLHNRTTMLQLYVQCLSCLCWSWQIVL